MTHLMDTNSNWFEVHHRHDSQVQPTNYKTVSDLLACIEAQVARQCKKSSLPCKSSFESRINPKTWQILNSTAKMTSGSPYYPILTFHGTPYESDINSILNYGYITNSDMIVETGYIGSMAHGGFFGNGVYSTTELDYCYEMGFKRDIGNGSFQILVNLVWLGNLQYVSKDEIEIYHNLLRGIDSKRITALPTPPLVEGGVFAGNYHCRVTGKPMIIVNADSRHILPLGIVTISPHVNWIEPPWFASMRSSRQFLKRFESLHYIHLFADYYMIPTSNVERVTMGNSVRNFVCLPPSNLFSESDLKYLKSFIESLPGTSHVVHYGDDVQFYRVQASVKFEDKAAKHQYLHLGLDKCCDLLTKENEVSSDLNIVYMFIAKPESTIEELEGVVKKWEKMTSARKTLIKLVFLDESIQVSNDDNWYKPFYNIKWTLDSKISCYAEEFYCCWQRREYMPSELGPLLDYMQKQNPKNGSNCLSLASEDAGGFIDDVCCLPRKSVETFNDFVLYQGKLPDLVRVNFEIYHLAQKDTNALEFKPLEQDCLDDSNMSFYDGGDGIRFVYFEKIYYPIEYGPISKKNQWLLNENCFKMKHCRISRDFVLQILNVRGNNYSLAGNFIGVSQAFLTLVCKFRNSSIKYGSNLEQFGPFLLNLTGRWLETCQNLTYGKQHRNLMKKIKSSMTRIAELQSEISTLTNYKFGGKWFEQFRKLKFMKRIAKRVTMPEQPEDEDFSDTLGNLEITGYGLRLIRSPASQVDPWCIKVAYISPDTDVIFTQLYWMEEMGIKQFDSIGRHVTDVLPVAPGIHPSAFYGYTFTRIPNLFIEQQPLALLCLSFVSSVEIIFMTARSKFLNGLCNDDSSKTELRNNLKDAFGISRRLAEKICEARHFKKILENVQSDSPQLGPANIQSLAMLYISLLNPDAEKIFSNKTKLAKFSRAVFIESIARNCRGYLRIIKDFNQETVIQNILCFRDGQLDIETSSKRTNRFYNRQVSNTGPFGVVALLEFLKLYHDGKPETFVDDVVSRKISMKNFLARVFPTEVDKGPQLQMALLIHGLKNFNKSVNNVEPFISSEDTLQTAIYEIELKKQAAIARQGRVKLGRERKELVIVAKRKQYESYHTDIHLFDHKEVALLNQSRPADDQLEIVGNTGLLKYHCCFKSCPQYLTSFKKIETTKASQESSRNGLFSHLRFTNRYPSFHLFANTLIKKFLSMNSDELSPFDKFVHEVDQHMAKKIGTIGIVYDDYLAEAHRCLKQIWEHAIRK